MYFSEGILKQMEKYNVASLKGFDPCIIYIGTGFIEYIKTITEVLHDLDLKADLNSVECLHLPISFLSFFLFKEWEWLWISMDDRKWTSEDLMQ